MSVGVVAVVFAMIAIAELPDKTMIAMLLMGSRSRPILVWVGCCAAFSVHVGLAVVAGRLLMLLPHRDLLVITTVLFLAGAAYLLFVPERGEEEKGAAEAAKAESHLESLQSLPSPPALKTVATAFGVILVGEFGDLTQLLTVNLMARYHQPLSVFVGALGALMAVSLVGAFGGRALLKLIPLAGIRRGGALVLIGFSVYNVYAIVR
ncbi:MAG: TMEM165/GDT1 family protein [Actinobacteria bacterium]|nr:TMEM165/GDT1 family protein [Actinomycetota bacterium]MCL5444746.1 TMEM165/GDT1 family protein [Actinomycetota bacterium]